MIQGTNECRGDFRSKVNLKPSLVLKKTLGPGLLLPGSPSLITLVDMYSLRCVLVDHSLAHSLLVRPTIICALGLPRPIDPPAGPLKDLGSRRPKVFIEVLLVGSDAFVGGH